MTTKCHAYASTKVMRFRTFYKVATPPPPRPPRPPSGGNNGNMGGWSGNGDGGGNMNNAELFIGLAILCFIIISLAEIHVNYSKNRQTMLYNNNTSYIRLLLSNKL